MNSPWCSFPVKLILTCSTISGWPPYKMVTHDFQTHNLKNVTGGRYIQKPSLQCLIQSLSGHSLYMLFNSAKSSKPIGSNNASKYLGSQKIFLKELIGIHCTNNYINVLYIYIYTNTHIYTYTHKH